MKYLILGVALTALSVAPAANAQRFGGLDNGTVLAGGIGAGLGGAIGSNLAPNGQGDEYTAIGGVLGGLAGASYGNRKSQYSGNPYAGRFNPGFKGRTLVGTGTGAALGGVIGSNLAGRGVRQEGTAIGAVLGGVAGYAISNRGANSHANRQVNGHGHTHKHHMHANRQSWGAPMPVRVSPPAPMHLGYVQGRSFSGPSVVHSGQYATQTFAMPPHRIAQPAQNKTVIVMRPRPKTQYIDREVVKYVDRVQTVEVPKIIEKPVVQYVDRVQRVEVPVDREVVKYVDRIQTVEVPKIIEKPVVQYVDRVQQIEVPVEREVVKYVDREVIKEVIKYVDRPVMVPNNPPMNPCGPQYNMQGSNIMHDSRPSERSHCSSTQPKQYRTYPSYETELPDLPDINGYPIHQGENENSQDWSPESVYQESQPQAYTSGPSNSATYCYSNSSKRYDASGREVKATCE